jgi:hypothetical protein
MISDKSFDILLDIKSDSPTNLTNNWRVRIPEKYHGQKLKAFVIEMESEFVFDVNVLGPTLTTVFTTVPGLPIARDVRRPYNDLRLRLTDIKSDCFTFTGIPTGVVAISYGLNGEIINPYMYIATYSLPDALYPIVFEVNNNEFNFQIETSNVQGDFLARPAGASLFYDDQKNNLWNCKYFVIKFRFIVLDD